MTTPRNDIAGLIKRLREESEYLAEEVGVQFTLLISENEALKAALIRAEQEREALQERVKEFSDWATRAFAAEAERDMLTSSRQMYIDLLAEEQARATRIQQERDEAYEERDSLVRDYQRVNAQLAEEMKARGRAEQERDEAYERCLRAAKSAPDLNHAIRHILSLASGPEKEG